MLSKLLKKKKNKLANCFINLPEYLFYSYSPSGELGRQKPEQ